MVRPIGRGHLGILGLLRVAFCMVVMFAIWLWSGCDKVVCMFVYFDFEEKSMFWVGFILRVRSCPRIKFLF